MHENKFYNCSRGPKTNFSKLGETQSVWEPRFWEKLEKTNKCWIWKGAKNDSGYGVMGVYPLGYKKTKLEYTHRISFFLAKGEIPSDKIIEHCCKTTLCCNPNHLILLEHEVNAISSLENSICGVCGDSKERKSCGRLFCRSCARKASARYKIRARERKVI